MDRYLHSFGGDFRINYDILSHARKFYEQWGFNYMETPWLVSEEADAVTRPVEAEGLSTKYGNLVASGEQGFIHLMLKSNLAPGRYQTLTPCFREEPFFDSLHFPWFMKLELIETRWTTRRCLEEIVETAEQFYKQYLPVDIVELSGTEFDIVTTRDEIELGSYNIKTYKNLRWICGTGVAEPRLSSQIRREGFY